MANIVFVVSRMNRVIDYIRSHLGENLSIETLAQIASMSPFHFHRLFKRATRETVRQFVERIRLEKATFLLEQNEKMSVVSIAVNCGFSSSQVFARSFKRAYDLTPSEYRNNSKKSNIISKKSNETPIVIDYTATKDRSFKIFTHLQEYMKVTIKTLPAFSVAYIHHIGEFKGNAAIFDNAFEKLCSWGFSRALMSKETKFLSVYRENNIVDICISVSDNAKNTEEISIEKLPGGEYAMASFEVGGQKGYEVAWDQLLTEWLPKSGYQLEHRPMLEIYLNDPKEHPQGHHLVELYIPVCPA